MQEDRNIVLKEMEDFPEPLVQEVLDFVRFLKAKTIIQKSETAILSEPALGKDWLRPEEDKAWQDL